MTDSHEERPPFEEAMAELETLVRRLEQGELPLEESLAAFERGMALVRSLAARLEDVAQRVEVLLRASDGSLVTRPLPDEEEGPRAWPSTFTAIWPPAGGPSRAPSRGASPRGVQRCAGRFATACWAAASGCARSSHWQPARSPACPRPRCCPSPAPSSSSTPTRWCMTISRRWTTTTCAAGVPPAIGCSE